MRYTVDKEKVLYADECFIISGVFFYCQNQLGRFAKEKQYGDLNENKFKELNIPYVRELVASSNRTDFVLYNKILVEMKAKPFLTKDDFDQVQRYLDILDLDLGLLVNFWSRSAQPYRVLRKNRNL